MTNEIEALKPDIHTIARGLAVEWPGIEVEDIRQEMFLAVVERWDNLAKRGKAEQRKIALGVAKKAGISYCARERQQYQAKTAEWIYTPREVRGLLAEFFEVSGWEDAPKRPEAGEQTITGDGISIPLMDVRIAFEAVAERHQAAIIAAYRMGEKPTVSGGGKMRLSRAVDALTANMNRRVSEKFDHTTHEGPGARHAVNNAQARAMTTNHY